MTDYDKNSYGKIPHGWFDQNQFIEDLTKAQRWILVCLAVYIWRSKIPNPDYDIDKELVRLYEKNRLLITLMSERTMAQKTGFNRSTVETAINRFDDYGAVIKVSGKKGRGFSNLHIMGFERREKQEKGRETRVEFLFSNSPILRAGGVIPDDIRQFIRDNYHHGSSILHENDVADYGDKVGGLIFHNNSPLVPRKDKAIRLDDYRKRHVG